MKLEGSVTNNSLPKIGELRYLIKKTSDVRNIFLFDGVADKAVTSTVSGKNYFTDVNGTVNNGKSISRKTTQDANRYFKSLEDGYYTISQKYDIGRILIRDYKDMEIDISDFSYCKNLTSFTVSNSSVSGNIASLNSLVNLTTLSIGSSSVSGNIASLNSLVNLTTLSIGNSSVSGNIASLNSLVNLTTLSIGSSSVSGNIASLNSLVNLTTLKINNFSVSGNIASLNSLVNLTTLSINNSSVSGDIASLNSLVNLTELNVSNSKVNGDCKNLFDGLVTAGKRNGILKILTINKEVSYNGEKPTKRVWSATFNNGSYSVENTDN